MKQTFTYRLHAGTASILLVFLTLCLVSFAVLSRASANADMRLSQKYAERTSSYYKAVSEAELFIAETDRILRTIKEESRDEDDYHARVERALGALTLTKEFEIGPYQVLVATITASYDERFTIDAFHVVTDESAFSFEEEPLNLPH